MELFTATGKLKKFFFFGGGQLDMFAVCTTGDAAHIDTIVNLNIVSMFAVSPVVHTANISSCQKNV